VGAQRRRPAAAPLKAKAPSGMSKRPAALQPSAQPPATKGLDALDRDRAASLADEGGAAGAQVEGPTLEEEAAMRQAMPIPRSARPDRPVPPREEPERPQERRLPGKDEITPAFDDSDETPVVPTRLRPAERDRGAK
jgi:hypothetical protein